MTLDDLGKRLAFVEKEVQVTRDIEAIKQLHYSYIMGFMLKKWDQVINCFSDDCVLDLGAAPLKGMAEIEKIYRGLSQHHTGKEGDWLVHPFITVDGDRAKGNWTNFMMFVDRGVDNDWGTGTYDAEYTKINGQWKISRLYHRWNYAPPGGPSHGKGGILDRKE
jgi:hypothetical protein